MGRRIGPHPGHPCARLSLFLREDRMRAGGALIPALCWVLVALKFSDTLCPGRSGSGRLFSDARGRHLCRARPAQSPGLAETVHFSALLEACPVSSEEQEVSKADFILASYFYWRVVAGGRSLWLVRRRWPMGKGGGKRSRVVCESCWRKTSRSKNPERECYFQWEVLLHNFPRWLCLPLPPLLRSLLLVLGFSDFCWLGQSCANLKPGGNFWSEGAWRMREHLPL